MSASNQTPFEQSSLLLPPGLLEDVRKAIHVSNTDLCSAIDMIMNLIHKDRSIGLLYQVLAELLYHYHKVEKKKRYLLLAIEASKTSTQLTPNSITFSRFLGYLLYTTATDANTFIEAIQEFTRALLINNPVDPALDTPFQDHSTTNLESRIKQVRDNVVGYVGSCVWFLKELDTEPLIFQQILQSLAPKLTKEEQVQLSWYSLQLYFHANPPRFCQVGVHDLLYYLMVTHKYLPLRVLSQALSCFEMSRKWNFWDCFHCNKIFPTSALLFDHVYEVHMEISFSTLVRILHNPRKVSDWFRVDTNKPWVPLDFSAPIELSHSTNKEEVTTPESFSNAGDKEQSTFHLIEKKRAELLSKIKSKLEQLLARGCLLAVHVDILGQHAIRKLDGRVRGLLKHLGLDQTHHCLCLLNASQLEETLDMLTKMSDFTITISEKESFLKETLGSDTTDEVILLSMDSKYLQLYEHSLSNESTSGGLSDQGNSYRGPSNLDDLPSWFNSNISRDDLTEWRNLRAERKKRGKQMLVEYEKFLAKSLKEFSELKKGLSVDILSTDVSELIVEKNKISALQKPEPDASTEGTIHMKSENIDSELNESDKWNLRLAMRVLHFETKIRCFAEYTYRPIPLSILKTYLRELWSPGATT